MTSLPAMFLMLCYIEDFDLNTGKSVCVCAYMCACVCIHTYTIYTEYMC